MLHIELLAGLPGTLWTAEPEFDPRAGRPDRCYNGTTGGYVTEITFTAGQLLAALVGISTIIGSGIFAAFHALRNDVRDLKETADAMQHENRVAHAAITKNIERVEGQQEKSLDRLYGLLSNVFPRAAAEQPPEA